MKRFLLITLVCLNLLPLHVFGQVTYQYDLATGIPSLHLYDITTDKNNLLWISSDNGLFAFDGYEFHSLKLTNNDVLEIHIDALGRMWGINASGNLFYVENNEVHNSENTPWLPKELSSIICKLIDHQSKLYITHQRYIDIIYKDGYHRFQLPGEFDNQVKQLWKYKNDVFVRDGLKMFKVTNGVISRVYSDQDETPIYDIVNIQDTLYLLMKDAICQMWMENNRFVSKKIATVSVPDGAMGTRFFEDRGRLYMYIQTKVLRLDLESHKLEQIYDDGVQVTRLCQDDYGNVWMTTFDKGLIQIPASKGGIRKIKEFDREGAKVGAFHVGKELAFGHYNGTITLGSKKFPFMNTPRMTIRDLDVIDEDIYAGTDGGLVHINARSGMVRLHKYASVKGFQFANNHLYYANGSGLYKIPEDQFKTGSMDQYGTVVHPNRVYSFLYDDGGGLWVSSITGFYHYKENKGELVFPERSSIQSACMSILQYAPEHIIMLTGDNEIYLTHRTRCVANKIYAFPSNVRINHIAVKDGTIWTSTNHGIMQLVPHPDKPDSFVTGTTIIFDQMLFDSDIAYFQIRNDSIYFSNSRGLYALKISDYMKDHKANPSLYSAECASGKLPNSNLFQLTRYDSKNLTLSWFDPCYCRLKFYYRFRDDENQEWRPMSRNVLHLPDLQLGKSTIEVAMSNGFSPPDNITAVTLDVSGRLMEYPWFKVALVSFIFMLIGGIWFIWLQIRNRSKVLRQELLLTEASLKLTSLQSQMNPHFLRNSLNSIQSLIHQNEKKKASQFISYFSQLIEEFIRLSGQNFISLEHEIQIISNFIAVEQLRFVDEFEFILDIPDDVPMHLEVPTMFLQPVVENAIEHGLIPSNIERKIVKICVRFVHNQLTIDVCDNGVGITGNGIQPESIALNNIQKRISTMNAFDDLLLKMDIFDHSKMDLEFKTGTTVRFYITYLE